MSALNQQQVSVPPGSSYSTVAMLQSNSKVGKVSLRISTHVKFNNQQQPVHSDKLLFKFQESEDASTWTNLNAGNPVTVPAGGDETVNLLIGKRFVRIQAKGFTNVGGYARIDTQLAGRLFQGQLEFVVLGKSGYGFDGQSRATSEGKGIQNMSTTAWPEGAAS